MISNGSLGWEQNWADEKTTEFTDIPRNLVWSKTKEVTLATTQIHFTYKDLNPHLRRVLTVSMWRHTRGAENKERAQPVGYAAFYQ